LGCLLYIRGWGGVCGPGHRLSTYLRKRDCTPTTLRDKLIKIRPQAVCHAKYVAFQMGDDAVLRELFGVIIERIQHFGLPPPPPQGRGRARLNENPDQSCRGLAGAA